MLFESRILIIVPQMKIAIDINLTRMASDREVESCFASNSGTSRTDSEPSFMTRIEFLVAFLIAFK